jgi:hypothetical protein
MPTTVPITGAEGGLRGNSTPKQPKIDYRPRNIPTVTILLTETSIRESMQKYPNAKKANSTLIKNMKEWHADPRTINSPQRKAVKAYIMAATGKPADEPAKAAPQTSVATTGAPLPPPEDPNNKEPRKTKAKKAKSTKTQRSDQLPEPTERQIKESMKLGNDWLKSMHVNGVNVQNSPMSPLEVPVGTSANNIPENHFFKFIGNNSLKFNLVKPNTPSRVLNAGDMSNDIMINRAGLSAEESIHPQGSFVKKAPRRPGADGYEYPTLRDFWSDGFKKGARPDKQRP